MADEGRQTAGALASPCLYKPPLMAGKYDTSFKELVTHHFGALLPWLLPGVHGAEVVRLSEELPATARHADLILRCDWEGAGSVLYLIECQ